MKYRSVLFVPGHEEKKIKKAYTLNADLIVLDLESTVPEDQKDQAKKIIKECNVNKDQTYIRINNNSDLEFVTFQTNLLNHLKTFDKTPVNILTNKKKPFASFIDNKNAIRYFRMNEWIDGRLWSSINPIDSILREN